MASEKEIIRELTKLNAAYPAAQLDTANLEIYAESFADVEADDLAEACKKARLKLEFFPSVAVLNKIIQEIQSARAEKLKQLVSADSEYLRQRLPPNHDCPRCFGTNLEFVYSTAGQMLGVRSGRKCEHEPLKPGEWLYKKHDGDPRYYQPEPEAENEPIF